ncbi:MAG: YfcE family phosphodiesterase, partial [Bacteroidetes bacterium HGW-Bacteroidetes-21]
MKKIGLLSDTHGIIIPEVYTFFEASDEIWHAGDIGNPETLDELRLFKPVRAVWGNIDNHIVRSDVPEFRRFVIEGVDVLMTHIGGYPGHYTQIITRVMKAHPPKLFISGHSHILRVM